MPENQLHASARIFLIIGFIVVISIPLLTMPFGSDKIISQQEQRRLTSKPEFSWNRNEMKNYSKQFNAYFDDHFGQRNRILSWGNQLKEKVFKRAKAKNVVLERMTGSTTILMVRSRTLLVVTIPVREN